MAPSFCPALTTMLLHLRLPSANTLHSPTTPTLQILFLTQSSQINHGIPHFLLPCYLNLSALFAILSCPIRIKYLAHLSKNFTNLLIKVICTPISSLSSSILLLRSTLFTPTILLTQLFSQTCSLCCCLCQCHSLQTAKVGQHYTRHQNLLF